ncbi:MAG: S8 family serine peptidase [Phycisphaerae bacterium]
MTPGRRGVLVVSAAMVMASSGLGTLSGCGGPAPTAPSAAAPFGFADDADPALAALPFVEDELLVQPYPGASPATLNDAYASADAVVVDAVEEIGLTVLRVNPTALSGTAATLAASGLIEAVHKNYVFDAQATPDDPEFPQQTHLTQISAVDAWDVTVGAADIVIAIVDTGVDPDHPDLSGKIIDGWNMHDRTSDFSDLHGHGTQVAGVAAAIADNGIGVAGVAWESPIIAVRVADRFGRATASAIAKGIVWAVSRDARVVNVSFAPLWSNSVVRAAAEVAFRRGALVVISAGNAGGLDLADGYAQALFVGAIDDTNVAAAFSDRGPFVDLAAPGVSIRTTARGGAYKWATGTSFAAPVVTGVAALAWSVRPELPPGSLAAALTDTAVDRGVAGRDDTYGAGSINALAAVERAMTIEVVPDAASPTLAVVAPEDGAVLSRRTVVRVTAADTNGVADVAMFINAAPYASDTRSPYRFVIDPTDFAPGSYVLSFVATDTTGNTSVTRAVTVTINADATADVTASRITFVSPPDGTSVTGNVTITADIEDADGLAAIAWSVDGASTFATAVAGQTSTVAYVWHAGAAGAGPHTISLTVTDAGGRTTTSAVTLIAP